MHLEDSEGCPAGGQQQAYGAVHVADEGVRRRRQRPQLDLARDFQPAVHHAPDSESCAKDVMRNSCGDPPTRLVLSTLTADPHAEIHTPVAHVLEFGTLPFEA